MNQVMRFLRTPLSPLDRSDVDKFENYIVAAGRRGYNSFKNTWTYKPNKYMSDEDLVDINSYRETILSNIEETADALRGSKKTIREYAEILCEFIIKSKCYTKLIYIAEEFKKDGDRMRSREYERLYPAMLSMFDNLVDLMGDEMVSLKEFSEVLGSGLSEGVLGFAPLSMHRMVIGDVERSRFPEVKAVFFLGNTDDIFPKGAGSPGILGDRERELITASGIELAPGAEELYTRELFYMYRILTKPSEKLYLTYTKTNAKGESTRPSYIIQRV